MKRPVERLADAGEGDWVEFTAGPPAIDVNGARETAPFATARVMAILWDTVHVRFAPSVGALLGELLAVVGNPAVRLLERAREPDPDAPLPAGHHRPR